MKNSPDNEAYVRNRTFSDPTAEQGIELASRSEKKPPDPIKQEIHAVTEQLRELNEKKRNGAITKREYIVFKAPLKADLKRLRND